MADYTPRQGSGVIDEMRSRWRDMLDGTHALVIATQLFFGGSPGTPVSETSPLPIDDTWAVSVEEDLALADSDKVLTVPAGYIWQVLWLWLEFTTDATVGNRQLQIDLRSDTDVIGQIRPNVVQAASLLRNYMIAPTVANQVAFYDTDHLQTPLPPTVFLPAGWSVRVFDNNVVSVGGDDLLIHMAIAQKLL